MMNIYLFELGMLKRSILIWSLAVSLSIFAYLAFFPAMSADAGALDELLASYPEEFLAFLGMRPDLPMSSILGYFALTFGMMQIPLAIQAANYGFHMLSVEEREMTADFLLSKPISRTQIIIAKFLAALTSLTIVNIATWIGSIAALLMFKGDSVIEFGNIILVLSTIVLFQLFFLSVGMLISVSVRKIASVISFSMIMGFGLYIVYGFKSLFSSEILAYFTPYAYFDPAEILVTGKLDLVFILVAIIIIIGSLSFSYILYNKRNIHSL